jgi:acylphosphatase
VPGLSSLKVCGLRVVGCVQGVGFRLATQDKARALGVLGWVRNLGDGSVEVRARGSSQSVDQLIAWLWQGPPTAKVHTVQVTDSVGDDLSGRESFVIR